MTQPAMESTRKPPKQYTVDVLLKNGRLSFPGAAAGKVVVDAPDSTITFKPSLGSDPFTFDAITFTPASDEFSYAVSSAGTLVVTDRCTVDATYNYCLTVVANGTRIGSDPEIVNKT
ncbi:MAG: hypothetical protein ACJ79S_01530 [Gemmatimonadaceae bacterium]